MRLSSDLRGVAQQTRAQHARRCSHTWHTDLWERPFTRRQAVASGAAALGVLALPRFAFGAPPSAGPNGHLGLTYVRGIGLRTNKATGATATLPFEVDLRFMKGEFVAADGRRRHGAFALI